MPRQAPNPKRPRPRTEATRSAPASRLETTSRLAATAEAYLLERMRKAVEPLFASVIEQAVEDVRRRVRERTQSAKPPRRESAEAKSSTTREARAAKRINPWPKAVPKDVPPLTPLKPRVRPWPKAVPAKEEAPASAERARARTAPTRRTSLKPKRAATPPETPAASWEQDDDEVIVHEPTALLAAVREVPEPPPKVDRPAPSASSERMAGVIKWFDSTRGYGFIATGQGPDHFVHYTGLEQGMPRDPTPGMPVTYELGTGRTGIQAVRVRPAS